MISLRLPPDIEKKISSVARTVGKTKSQIIKESILEFLEKHEEEMTPFELGKDLFGRFSSGKIDLAENRKNYLKSKMKQKNEKRSSD